VQNVNTYNLWYCDCYWWAYFW